MKVKFLTLLIMIFLVPRVSAEDSVQQNLDTNTHFQMIQKIMLFYRDYSRGDMAVGSMDDNEQNSNLYGFLQNDLRNPDNSDVQRKVSRILMSYAEGNRQQTDRFFHELLENQSNKEGYYMQYIAYLIKTDRFADAYAVALEAHRNYPLVKTFEDYVYHLAAYNPQMPQEELASYKKLLMHRGPNMFAMFETRYTPAVQ